ncbi:MAG: hypothetical protein C0497_13280 [Gemmatimonas sp.]|nr:hypothetical protein [Gemmatimonas sp.]
MAEFLGGQLVAPYSGLAPDLLEPAIHGHHRQFFHSASCGAILYRVRWDELVQKCRANAEAERERALTCAPNTLASNDAHLRAFLWHMLAGATRAALPCYLAHLAMDATTPRSIPLVGR